MLDLRNLGFLGDSFNSLYMGDRVVQEKLSDFDVRNLERARSAILAINWKKTSEGESYWSEIHESLCGKIRYGTSDGKPWVEPKVEIPEGYRLAKPEEHVREDVMFRGKNGPCWLRRSGQGEFSHPVFEATYIVPIDAVPPERAKEPSREELGAELEGLRSDLDEVGGLLKDEAAPKGYRLAAAFSIPIIQKKIDELEAKIKKDQERELTDEDACVWPRRWVMARDGDNDQWRGPYRYLGKCSKDTLPFIGDSIDGRNSRCWKQARLATAEEIKEAGL